MRKVPKMYQPGICKELNMSYSRFVKVSDKEIDVKMQYPLLGFENASEDCFVREEVYEMLLDAQKKLPNGLRLRIWDAWRPFALQKELYNEYSERLIKSFGLENKSAHEQESVIEKYVSYPEENVLFPPVHTTGGAVDVTLIDKQGRALLMGTEFDAFSDMTKTDYFEIHSNNSEIRNNRRILYNAMTDAGFTNYPSEWWHYDFGDRFWAFYKDKNPVYEGIFDIKGMVDYENKG